MACIEFILSGGAHLVSPSRKSLSQAMTLMEKYKDIPMDFTDATLVVLAEDVGAEEVFTLDKRGFSAYRLHGKKHFSLLPE